MRVLPAYPLFIKDPNFSIWSYTEQLNGENVKTWFGEEKHLYGFVKIEGKTYCFLGNAADLGVEKAEQTDLSVSAFATKYSFACGSAKLNVSFVSPLPLNDLDLLSLPVCYMEYEILGAKDAEISLFMNRDFAYNVAAGTSEGLVLGGVVPHGGIESAYLGLSRQLPLSNAGDLIGADWGYYYLSGETAFFTDKEGLIGYLSGNGVSYKPNGDDRYICAFNKSLNGVLCCGYDEGAAIDYFGDYKKGYYLENHTVYEGIEYVWQNYEKINKALNRFDQDLCKKAEIYGQEYKEILYASYRQSVAAHKLVRDNDGNVLWLSKECGSNGCIATVDVSYPSMPLFLLYNPELVKGMMRPILDFARMPVWKYDFAPHDVGTYPICCGQVYGVYQDENSKFSANFVNGGYGYKTITQFPIYKLPKTFDAFTEYYQMPVEECADMLIMFYAVYKQDKDAEFFAANADLAKKWVIYLVENGLKPANQLCTDDFAGHLANNLNLAIKASVGIACYAELLKAINKDGTEYEKIAEDFAKEIEEFSKGKTHLPLSWDTGEDTYGLKYNLAFDKIFGLKLFSKEFMEKEVDYYLSKSEKYGIPLDNRKKYVKSDWLLWVARTTDDIEKQKKIIAPIREFLVSSPTRIPFADLYEGDSGEAHGFRARSVQGGCFILLI